jgi:hypothetical protein
MYICWWRKDGTVKWRIQQEVAVFVTVFFCVRGKIGRLYKYLAVEKRRK